MKDLWENPEWAGWVLFSIVVVASSCIRITIGPRRSKKDKEAGDG